MASTEKSIKQLPTISSIESGNFLVVQTENATNKLDFKDFVIGFENITFANTINNNTTNIEALSSTLYGSTPTTNAGQSTHSIPIVIGGVNYAIMLSATS